MSSASPNDMNRSFIVLLQLVDIAVSAHTRGDQEVRDYALDELGTIMKNYRLRNVLTILGNHM
ncbi:MAG: hypothetical protein LUO93_11170 [Methanomicrobiales archaeon]|nr:hypothetical protein [Methanomicrobiales archaeon]MDD1679728.1 hypothetical protein [Methanomicrobiales archaeon]